MKRLGSAEKRADHWVVALWLSESGFLLEGGAVNGARICGRGRETGVPCLWTDSLQSEARGRRYRGSVLVRIILDRGRE